MSDRKVLKEEMEKALAGLPLKEESKKKIIRDVLKLETQPAIHIISYFRTAGEKMRFALSVLEKSGKLAR